jgi:peptidyl-tRNA hydrolase, PTH1 family
MSMESERTIPAPNLIVGLGNPGAKYQRTRHNAGFMLLDRLVADSAGASWKSEGKSLEADLEAGGGRARLAKPMTYMNRSGEAVAELLGKYGLEAGDLLVVVDDFSLPFGRIRIRQKGSAGGHNGLESIIRALGTTVFMRIRLGIGEENMPEDKAGFVLEEFPLERERELSGMILRACDAVKTMLSLGVAGAMSAFNVEAVKGE